MNTEGEIDVCSFINHPSYCLAVQPETWIKNFCQQAADARARSRREILKRHGGFR